MSWEHQQCRPDLYRKNAFRLLGLSVRASEREIRDQYEKLKHFAKYGSQGLNKQHLLPLDFSPAAEELKEAAQYLNDPESRILDEFFWFWPLPEEGNAQQNAFSVEDWKRHESDPEIGGIAIHNLAVFFHAQALDLEALSTRKPLIEKQELQLTIWWEKAFYHWTSLLDRDDFWVQLSERIREIDDPRLTTGFGRRLHQNLPAALLRINSQLAIRAILAGQTADAYRHIEIIQANWFANDFAQEAMRLSLKPLQQRLRDLCKKAELQAVENPRRADQVVASLLSDTAPLLAMMGKLLPEENEPEKIAAHDGVAESANTSLQQFGNATRNWKKVILLLTQIRAVALSESRIRQIEQGMATVASNASETDFWYVDGYHDLPDQFFDSLEEARERVEDGNLDEAIAILVGLLTNKNSTLPIGSEYYVKKPLSFCLNIRSAAGFNNLIERYENPLTVIAQINARKSASSVPSFAQYDDLIDTGNKCAACARELQNARVILTLSEGRFNICPMCNNSLNKEQDSKRSQISKEIKPIAYDLIMACCLDPYNNQASADLAKLSNIVKAANFDLPAPILAEIHFGLAKTDDLVRAATSYSGKTSRIIRDALRSQDQTAYEQLVQAEQKERKKKLLLRSAVALVGIVILAVGLRFLYPSVLYFSDSPSAVWQTYQRGARDRAGTLHLLASNFGKVSREERKEITNHLKILNPTPGELKPLLVFLTDENIEIRQDTRECLRVQNFVKSLLLSDLAALLGYGSEKAQKEIIEQLQTISPNWITSEDAGRTLNRLWVQMGQQNRRQAALALQAIGIKNLERNGYNVNAISEAVTSILGDKVAVSSPSPQNSRDSKTARSKSPAEEQEVLDSPNLQGEIQQNRDVLQRLEQGLGQIKNDLKSNKRTVEEMAAQLRRAKRANDAGGQIDQGEFNDAVDRYNQYVRQYNQQLSVYQQKQNEYEQLLKKTNQMIRQYNQFLTR